MKVVHKLEPSHVPYAKRCTVLRWRQWSALAGAGRLLPCALDTFNKRKQTDAPRGLSRPELCRPSCDEHREHHRQQAHLGTRPARHPRASININPGVQGKGQVLDSLHLQPTCAGPRRFAPLWMCARWMSAQSAPGFCLQARGPALSPPHLRLQALAVERANLWMLHARARLAERVASARAHSSLCATAQNIPVAPPQRMLACLADTLSERLQRWPALLLRAIVSRSLL